jgi:hypothetical protein
MKTFALLPTLVFLALFTTAQINLTLVPSNYHGSNISCHGLSDGSISAVPTDGTEPYTYLWSTSATTSAISSLAAGSYTVTVTDAASQSATASIDLAEPNTFQLSLSPKLYPGLTNISAYGASDGQITASSLGGTPPIQLLWSTTATTPAISSLAAGNYSCTITDMNGCTAYNSVTLTQPPLFHITSLSSPLHHSYEVSCGGSGGAAGGGSNDGAIDLAVTGGVSPYQFFWLPSQPITQQPDPQHLHNLAAGVYHVTIKDMNNIEIESEIELHAPTALSATVTPYYYSNNYNLSGYESGNGSITVEASGGVSGYSYQWSMMPPTGNSTIVGQGTTHITNCIAAPYSIQVTDANGCTKNNMALMSQPSKNAWSMTGDANTNPASQFIGTNDEQDLVFKTNSQERMRIGSGCNFKITCLQGSTNALVETDVNGNVGRSNLQIGHLAAGEGHSEIFSFGLAPDLAAYQLAAQCNPPTNLNQFTGVLQSRGLDNGNLNVMNFGFDGANGFIDVNNETADPTPIRLLLNYYCGKDVFVGNFNSGDLTTNHNLFALGSVGIGTTTPSQRLQIDHNTSEGGIALNHLSNSNGSKSEIKFNKDGTELWAIGNDLNGNNHSTFFIWNHTHGRVPFYIDENENIGIGTITPAAKLNVTGEVLCQTTNVAFNYGFHCIGGNANTKAIAISDGSRENFLVYANGGVQARSVRVTQNGF